MTVVSHKTVNNDVGKTVFPEVIPCQKDKVYVLTRYDNGVERSPTSRVVPIFKEVRASRSQAQGVREDSASG